MDISCKNSSLECLEWFEFKAEVDLDLTFNSGQIFNFIKIENEYCGFVGDNLFILRQKQRFFEYKKTSTTIKEAISDFFNLKIKLPEVCHDNFGLKPITNDFYSTLFSFICSQNNNIKRIKKMVCFLFSFGDFVVYKSFKIYKLPSFLKNEEMEPENFCESLKKNGFGYRSKYILNAIQDLKTNANLNPISLHNGGYTFAKKELLKIKGIGQKVADCICLMGLKFFHVVPIDTHILKYSRRFFKESSKIINYEKIQNKWIELYGEFAGIVQLHVFYNSIK